MSPAAWIRLILTFFVCIGWGLFNYAEGRDDALREQRTAFESCEDVGLRTIPHDDPRYGGECH